MYICLYKCKYIHISTLNLKKTMMQIKMNMKKTDEIQKTPKKIKIKRLNSNTKVLKNVICMKQMKMKVRMENEMKKMKIEQMKNKD